MRTFKELFEEEIEEKMNACSDYACIAERWVDV